VTGDRRASGGRQVLSAVSSVGTVRWVVSVRDDGDFRPERVAPELLWRRQRQLVDLPWTLVDQVHGTGVVEVAAPGEANAVRGDIIATSVAGAVIGIWVGDCVPLLLISPQGRIVMAHVGWRGLVAGVVQEAVRQLVPSVAVIGPHIRPCCYQFSRSDIELVARSISVDPELISPASEGHGDVLDMGAAVGHVLKREGVADLRYGPEQTPVCTGCDQRWFSHRIRSESERHVMAAWRTR
jgi:copper oxidase (laccase) domain-containing protein